MRFVGRSEYRLSTGRVIDAAVGGFIGINQELRVVVGHDAEVVGVNPADAEDGICAPEEVWTPAERRELAEFMIEQWRRFGGLP